MSKTGSHHEFFKGTKRSDPPNHRSKDKGGEGEKIISNLIKERGHRKKK